MVREQNAGPHMQELRNKAAATAPFSSTGPHGHRSRMRTRLLASEAALADYEILEMLLFLGIPRRDTKPQAKALINRFGSLAATLTAGAGDLRREGLPPQAIDVLELVAQAAERLARPEQAERIVLGTWNALQDHLEARSRLRSPGLGALLLNSRNVLVGESQWPPDVDPATLTQEALRQALDRHATAVILVRRQGDAPPAVTAEDHGLHGHFQRAAASLSVTVHDLVVMGGGDLASLRQQGRH